MATISFTVRACSSGFTTSTPGTSTTCVMATKSFVGVTPSFGNTAGLSATVPTLPRYSV
jgi:hypothetical protein